jgi:hypothetical protein
MTQTTIQCRASVGAPLTTSKPWKQGEPVQFIWCPGGLHQITAGFRHNDSITIAVDVDRQTAADVQASFDDRTSDSGQEPYGDEDHESKKATLRFPKDGTIFEWGNLKGRQGIIVTGEPTSYGAEAVNGKVYRSWSPEFETDADCSKAICLKCSEPAKKCDCDRTHYGFPAGVRGSMANPARIVGVNFVVGALTNKPAFQAMPPVMANKAGSYATTPNKLSPGLTFLGNVNRPKAEKALDQIVVELKDRKNVGFRAMTQSKKS